MSGKVVMTVMSRSAGSRGGDDFHSGQRDVSTDLAKGQLMGGNRSPGWKN